MQKSLKSQLLVAIAMTLVACLALGSSTFAWFTANTMVSATGMKLQANAGKNLVIKNSTDDDKDYATSVETVMKPKMKADGKTIDTNYQLSPCSANSTLDSNNKLQFFKLDVSKDIAYATYSAGVGSSFKALDTGDIIVYDSADQKYVGYVVKHSYKIKTGVDGTELYDLYVDDIAVTQTGNYDISKALRVAVVCGANAFIYAPVQTSDGLSYFPIKTAGTVATYDTTSKIYKNSSSTALNEAFTALNDGTLGTYDETKKAYPYTLAATVDNSGVAVDVYMWYEGEDPNCTSLNAFNIDQLAVSVDFKIATTEKPTEAS